MRKITRSKSDSVRLVLFMDGLRENRVKEKGNHSGP